MTHQVISSIDVTIGGRSIDRPSPAEASSPWIGVHFVCAGAYTRVHRTRAGDAYVALCPRCGKSKRFRVGSGGTNQRLFKVSCR